MMSSIEEPPKTYCLSVWDLIKQQWLWEKSMKAFVVRINRPRRWSGYCVEPVSIGLLWWPIVFATIKVAKSARSLEIFSLCLLLCFILSSNHGLFHSWGLDFIGQIYPPSSKGHRFVLVATDYFTKWTEGVPLKNMTHKEVIKFITEHIIHRFGIPQTLTTDQGTSFVSKEVREFAELYKIKLLNSFPYYA